MIPLKLQIRNFLSYGPDTQTISFSPYRLLCLSGKNGHGKSALLDAITWSIWGQARKISGSPKPDTGLLRLGQTHMLVSLDFLFNGQQYRTKREFSLLPGNKQVSTLDFGIWDATTHTYKPLTGKTTRETQERIEQTLNLDFESFVNSAFLRQGQANEFSKKSPKERKEILAAILGLNKYDPIRTLALEKIRTAVLHKAQLIALQEKRTSELEAIVQVKEALTLANQELKVHAEHELQLTKEKIALDQQKKEHAEQQKKLQFLQFQHEQKTLTIKELLEKIRALVTQWRFIHKKSRTIQQQKTLIQEKNRLTHALHEEQRALQKQLELKQQHLQQKEQLHAIAQQIKEIHARTYTAQQLIIERIALALQNTQTTRKQMTDQYTIAQQELLKIRTNAAKISTEITALKKNTSTHDALIKQFEKRKEHYQKYIAYGNLLKTEQISLIQKKELAHDETNPSCPLCEQNLSAARKRFLKQKFDEQEEFLAYRLGRVSTLIQKLKGLLLSQHETLTQGQKTVESITLLQAHLEHATQSAEKIALTCTTYTTQIQTADRQKQELKQQYEQEQKKLLELEKSAATALEQHLEYHTRTQALITLEKEIESSSYNEQTYQKLIHDLQNIERHIAEYEAIQKESGNQEQRRQDISSLCVSAKKIKQERAEIAQEIEQYRHLETKKHALIAREQQIENEQMALNIHKEKLMHTKGSFESQLIALEKTKKEFEEQSRLITDTDTIIDDYQAIAQAISKDGIQALLIEEAIPEIEQAANDILGRLTNNQAHISIESLKDLKKGGTRETLEINISDTAGIRAYELFSGGEAFRIDFALRIAISKLLARRAGTSLQTLIIDEGFGSQDEEGLNNIMNAIYAIQDDFSKIIIVSHLPSLKDQFPVHMVVEKGAHGSTVNVFEQG